MNHNRQSSNSGSNHHIHYTFLDYHQRNYSDIGSCYYYYIILSNIINESIVIVMVNIIVIIIMDFIVLKSVLNCDE